MSHPFSKLPRSWPLPVLLAAACGYVTGTAADASLSVSFHGATPALLPALVELSVQSEHRSYRWVGGVVATPSNPQDFSPVALISGDSLIAVAILRTPQGAELARAVTGIRVKAQWLYGIGFQAGGINPDVGGFCHQPPRKVAIPGFPGDTLFVWTSGLPDGAVC